ncbi:MAG: M28 family peptidase [Gemmatimonadetes bacterium]|nr:M28 family peptidase [Gemmatimonadota bacterium]
MTTSSLASDVEHALLQDVSVTAGWQLIERFASLARESGMTDELDAADCIAAALDRFGVSYEMFEPDLYLSLPRGGSVSVGEHEFQAKPPSFARPTPEGGVTAPAVYLEVPPVRDLGELFDDMHREGAASVAGKVVVTNGYAMPSAVQRFERAGAVAQIYINRGDNIHWGICTPIWGTPIDGNIDEKPRTPVVAINHPDGERLVAAVSAESTPVTVRATLEEGWYRCKLPVATIPGASDDFLLVHGHYDSWGVGIGDNAVGDATLLELARIFHGRRDRLRRSLKVAWWPGHSTGRYAGSTWFADQFATELRKRCVAAVNIDSPGCRGASAFEDVMWMAETDRLCRGAITDATGQPSERRRPIRAGDYSFNQIGLSSFFMLLSNIPAKQREELGYYPVGGCGGNIAWHTEDDVLNIADATHLEQDLKVYVTAIARVLNAEVLPLDHRAAVQEIAEGLAQHEAQADGLVDFGAVNHELQSLQEGLDGFYAAADDLPPVAVNRTIVELSRLLVPLNYARGPRFQHDPALPLGVVPILDDVAKLKPYAAEQRERLPFLQAGIRRSLNVVANTLYEAAELTRHHS